MRFGIHVLLLSALLRGPVALADETPSPYEKGTSFAAAGRIDELQLANLRKLGIKPANVCSDAVFLRRAFLDIAGTVPTLEETKSFLSDTSEKKRAKLVDQLLEREEFALYWSLKWGDILRIKSEFPINMWPNAVHAFSHWVWDSVRRNKPYDQFARELITASGSNFRDPPVNFYRSTRDKSPAGLARIAALAFLGSRFQDWGRQEQEELQKLFSRVAYKKTAEWKEEIVFPNPEPVETFSVNMPGGTVLVVDPETDPREAFAGWLTGPAKKWFARAAVNRVWFWLFGRGIVHEADSLPCMGKGQSADKLHPGPAGAVSGANDGGAPANPELLDWLADEFIRSGYDFKALVKRIANSSTYQQSCIPGGDLAVAEKYFAVYKSRRIDAEVLADALSYFSGARPKYTSVIPEPFTYVPEEYPSIALNDGSITSSFLETFGRAARDTGHLSERNNDCTYAQRLFLLNSSEIQNRVCNTGFLKAILKESQGNAGKVIDDIYLLVLSRNPTSEEVKLIMANYADIADDAGKSGGAKGTVTKNGAKSMRRFRNANLASKQLVWTLVNSEEFLFKH